MPFLKSLICFVAVDDTLSTKWAWVEDSENIVAVAATYTPLLPSRSCARDGYTLQRRTWRGSHPHGRCPMLLRNTPWPKETPHLPDAYWFGSGDVLWHALMMLR